MTRHTRPWKEEQLGELKKAFSEYPVIGVIDLTNCPANLIQNIRKNLSKDAKVCVSKTRVIKKALEASDLKEKEKLLELLTGSKGIVFTNLNAFELYSTIKKNRIDAPIKAGMEAEEDIVVPEGDTGLPPGPLLSSLKAAKIPAKIEGASIQVMQDFTAVKKGEIVSPENAEAFTTLNMKPLKIGLDLSGAYAEGELFTADVLDIDLEEFEAKIQNAYTSSFNLACEICYVTEENIEVLLQKAFREAKEVCIEGNVLNKSTVGDLLGKASRQANALQEVMPEAAGEEKVEEKKEGASEEKEEKPAKEAPAEEKKEEVKEEASEEKPKEEGSEEKKEGASEEKKEEAVEEKTEEVKEEPKEEKAEEKPAEEKKEEAAEEKKE